MKRLKRDCRQLTESAYSARSKCKWLSLRPSCQLSAVLTTPLLLIFHSLTCILFSKRRVSPVCQSCGRETGSYSPALYPNQIFIFSPLRRDIPQMNPDKVNLTRKHLKCLPPEAHQENAKRSKGGYSDEFTLTSPFAYIYYIYIFAVYMLPR